MDYVQRADEPVISTRRIEQGAACRERLEDHRCSEDEQTEFCISMNRFHEFSVFVYIAATLGLLPYRKSNAVVTLIGRASCQALQIEPQPRTGAFLQCRASGSTNDEVCYRFGSVRM